MTDLPPGSVGSVAAFVESLVDYAVHLDKDTAAALETLEGKRIALDAHDVRLHFVVHVTDGRIRLQAPGKGETSDVSIGGESSAFLSHLLSGSPWTNGKGLTICGDVQIARRFDELLRDYAPDIEERLSAWIGDTAAHKTMRAGRGLRDLGKQLAEKLQRDLGEYLTYEAKILIDEDRVQDFIREVDELRDRLERLKRRIERLQTRIEKGDS